MEFSRKVTAAGSSEYRINGKTCKFDFYAKTLETHGILIKSKNFLVFQGYVIFTTGLFGKLLL